ncbi:UvrD-helicase domain-containing protein [Gudongella sp. SC589]|uniref:UvrD-helicase domain-containing protein n=1 Tax=Gudongella sp. SC589 TaxID=3385990 RepID=UPI0039047BB3
MDLSRTVVLESSNELINNIETHFKLYAGPGSGKTRFIVNHIKNVITNSNRLKDGRKIACITYTNIGVDTINKRLSNAVNEVEVSTIHSFLYKHVVKPYLWVINDEYSIPLPEVDGHDEIMPRFSLMKEWLERTGQQYVRDFDKLKKELVTLRWVVEDEEILLRFKYPSKLMISNDSLIEYKKVCWEKALISHDDILYLSYKILLGNSRILEILRAKFPYIFVDEFQDTSPIQSKILKMIANKETVIGVIGDYGQAIFSFQGSDVQEFINFDLEAANLYKLENNHRSTEEIIKILNHVRNDVEFKQISPSGKTGKVPCILVGNFLDAYYEAVRLSKDKKLYTLSYRNDVSNAMKLKYEFFFDSEDINEPIFRDSNDDRGWIITYTIIAIEHCIQGKIKDALKYMKKAYRKINNFGDKEILTNLKRLVNEYDNYREGTIKYFYNNYIAGHNGIKHKITSGKINEYYSHLKYEKIAISVKLNDDDSLHRTIHKCKGGEFKSVLVIIPSGKFDFDEEKNLQFLLNPNLNKEENRVYYVALSRAMENLFINVPKLSEQNKYKLEKVGFDVIYIKNN